MRLRAQPLVWTLAFTIATAAAAGPRLLKDLEPGTISLQIPSFQLLAAGSQAFFLNFLPERGIGLWTTSGAPGGTQLIRDLARGGGGSGISAPLVLGDRLIFALKNRNLGQELWVADSSAQGARPLKDICPGACWGVDQVLGINAGKVFFDGIDPEFGNRLWTTDGTAEGTQPVKDLFQGPLDGAITFWAPLGPGFVFATRTFESPTKTLWQTDGTSEGTRIIRDFDETPILLGASSEALGDQVLFRLVEPGIPEALWITDTTAPGTHLLRTLPTDDGFHRRIQSAVASDGNVFFFVFKEQEDNYGASDCELWKSDGTTVGTTRIISLRELRGTGDGQPPPAQCPFEFAALGGRIFFSFSSPESGNELWATDGTATGTGLFADLLPGEAGSYPAMLTRFQDRLWFRARNGTAVQLLTSDGTVSGTRAIQALDRVGSFLPFSEQMLVSVFSPDRRSELWLTDGTETGTTLAYQAPPIPGSSSSNQFLRIGDRILFSARTNSTGSEPWTTDGTPEGTEILDLSPGLASTSTEGIRRFGRRAYFTSGSALWRSDGTARGTRKLADLAQGNGIPLGGFVYLAREGGLEEGYELWRTDGTAEGTSLVKDIFPGSSHDPEYPDEQIAHSSFPRLLERLGDRIIFVAADSSHGRELWVTDGTSSGTLLLADLSPGSNSSYIAQTTLLGDRLFFSVGGTLGVTDGTPTGTRLLVEPPVRAFRTLSSLVAFRGRLMAVAFRTRSDLSTSVSLWSSDGTPAGTLKAFDFPETLELQSGLTVVGSHLFLAAWDRERGTELWSTDGTAESLTRVRDIFPGNQGSNPLNFQAVDGVLLFAAETPGEGYELWRSDGTEEGTRSVSSLEPGVGSSLPGGFTPLGDQVLFSAYQSSSGRELWAVARDEIRASCSPGPGRLCLAKGRFEVVVDWHNQRTGARGTGTSAGFSDDTGFFSFFNEANVELLVKMLDGRQSNGRHWFFSGALSDVEYWTTVTDFQTGRVETFHNPPFNICGRGETRIFDDLDVTPAAPLFFQKSSTVPPPAPEILAASETDCSIGPEALRLRQDRFAVEVSWHNHRNGATGKGTPVAGTDQSGYFWFFNPDNLELTVKLLDGTTNNGHFWFFSGGLSDVEYEIKVTDTTTCRQKIYLNPPGEICGQSDLFAFGASTEPTSRGPAQE